MIYKLIKKNKTCESLEMVGGDIYLCKVIIKSFTKWGSGVFLLFENNHTTISKFQFHNNFQIFFHQFRDDFNSLN